MFLKIKCLLNVFIKLLFFHFLEITETAYPIKSAAMKRDLYHPSCFPVHVKNQPCEVGATSARKYGKFTVYILSSLTKSLLISFRNIYCKIMNAQRRVHAYPGHHTRELKTAIHSHIHRLNLIYIHQFLPNPIYMWWKKAGVAKECQPIPQRKQIQTQDPV